MLEVSRQVAPQGFFYAPDPSSQVACTLGGNVAENSGGPHCLKYGTTVNHILELTVVLGNGDIMRLGSAAADAPGYDLCGVFVGSEGTFGIATEIRLRLVRLESGDPNAPGRLPRSDTCDPDGHRYRGRRYCAGRSGNDGPRDHPGGGGFELPRGLPARCRRRPAHRTGRSSTPG